ncbi:MAG: dipicolinate synthase subunit DpsA [Ruminococcaceae bacterium]|nr:dipicolinate synthase subunit DpsA [Oscillospiraceae bacterium]
MKLFVIGGDSRIGYMAEELGARGEAVTGLGISSTSIPVRLLTEGVREADAVILGVPATRDNETVFAPHYSGLLPLEGVLKACLPQTPLLCGMPGSFLETRCKEAGIPLIDYFAREELALLNAVPTAEGAVEIAMRELPITLWQARCLVVGFGRIGKYLSRILTALGAKVTVSARKAKDFSLARMLGYDAVHTESITRSARNFDVIFNTVPEKVIDAAVLSTLPASALIIDLASLPGGVDTEAARAFGVKRIHALSLPGKVAPVTAGKILCDTVRNIFSERN